MRAKSLRIGDLANIVGVPVATIRYYEQKGLIEKPEREFRKLRADCHTSRQVRGCAILQDSALIAQGRRHKIENEKQTLGCDRRGKRPITPAKQQVGWLFYPIGGSATRLRLIVPIVPFDRMRLQIAIHRLSDGREEVLFADHLEQAVVLQAVLHRPLQLREA